MDHEEHVSVSNSKFWKDWRESRVYKLQISVFSGDLLMNAKCDLKPSQMDPYFVIFLAKDRENSKKKTQVLKRTTTPAWNECISFSDLDYTETICFEMKIPAFSMTNPLLAHLSFTVQELLSTPINDLGGFDYAFTSDLIGLDTTVRLGFKFDTPLVGVEASTEAANTSVFLNTHDAFASFVFFPLAGGTKGSGKKRVSRQKIDSDDDTDYDDDE
jgi:hypothetical protein